MQDMEKRINEAFPKALLHMEEENAFWAAHEHWDSAWYALEKAGFWDMHSDIDEEESADTPITEAAQHAMDVYVLATDEYEAAEKVLKAIPSDVLMAKRNMAKARYYFAEIEVKRRESELKMVVLNEFLADVTPRNEMSDEQTDAWIRLECAKAEFFKLKKRYEVWQRLGGG